LASASSSSASHCDRSHPVPFIPGDARGDGPATPAGPCPLDADLPSLDPLETARGSVPAFPSLPDPDQQHENQLHFRHSFWRLKRATIEATITDLAPYSHALRRFQNCGQNCWILECATEPGRYRLGCDRCRSRWCDACGQERRRTVAKNLCAKLCERFKLATPHIPCKHIRFLTLTLRSTTAPLVEQLDRLYSSFGKFRNRSRIKKSIRGGIAFLELSRNRETGAWHPHLHILFEGDYLPQVVARTTWHEITRDSYIVDIRQIRTIAEAAGYVVKYATKSIGANVWRDPNALRECMVALVGRRTFNAFGTWKCLSLARPAADDLDWNPVCSLNTLITRARSGERNAVLLLARLTKGPTNEPTDSDPHNTT